MNIIEYSYTLFRNINWNLSENEEELKWRRCNNMKIEGNQKELDAMVEFHKENRVEGLRLQEEFAAEFRKEYKDKDHCPCLKACRYHGNCKECVAIHRAHQEHVPNCMRPLINKKLKLMSELTEHTLANEIEAPHEILRKKASQIPVYWEVAENEKSQVVEVKYR